MTQRGLLDPKVLARIGSLRLLAQLAVDGYLHGAHPGAQRGVGLEFSQYRVYEPGDDPQHIDWKLYARSDRMFVRQAERESQLCVWLVLDTSASMLQPSGQIDQWTRLDCARAVAASLGYLANRQGDALGLFGLADEAFTHLPARAGQRHFDAFLQRLETLRSGTRWPQDAQLGAVWDVLERPGLVVLISDFFQQREELEVFCAKLRAAGKEVLALQLLTTDEVAFRWRGGVEFVDRETADVVQVNASVVRSAYRRRMRAAQSRLQRVLGGLGIALHSATIEQPIDDILFAFLQHRRRGEGGRPRGAA